jgi:hypothetical protein
VTWRLKARIVEPKMTVVARQRIGKHVPAATKGRAEVLGLLWHRQQADLTNPFLFFFSEYGKYATNTGNMKRAGIMSNGKRAPCISPISESIIDTLRILRLCSPSAVRIMLYTTMRSWSRSYFMTDSQSVCMSWCRAHSGTCDHILLPVGRFLSESCRLCLCWASSLTRGLVCSLQCNHSVVRVAQNP